MDNKIAYGLACWLYFPLREHYFEYQLSRDNQGLMHRLHTKEGFEIEERNALTTQAHQMFVPLRAKDEIYVS